MPLRPKTIEKLYWTIGEVADELGVNNSTIRFWEKEFGMSAARRTGKGDRLYTRKEIEHLQRIQHLVKEKGFTLKGARNHLRTIDPEEPRPTGLDLAALEQRLLLLRAKALELAKQLA